MKKIAFSTIILILLLSCNKTDKKQINVGENNPNTNQSETIKRKQKPIKKILINYPAPKKLGIGIVIGSKLSCRKEPNLKSKIIKSFHYGTPIRLIAVNKKNQTINYKKAFWYKEKFSGGWVFGGYLIHTEYNPDKLANLKYELIRCNVVCGGFSCFNHFAPILVGDYYIGVYALSDYPEDDAPAFGILIGKYKKYSDKLVLNNVSVFGGFDSSKNYILYAEEENFEYKEQVLKKFGYTLYKHKDNNGYYYTSSKKEKHSRDYYRNLCKDKKNKKEIWESGIEYHKKSIKELQKMFPFI